MTTFSFRGPSPTPPRSVQFALNTGNGAFDYVKDEQREAAVLTVQNLMKYWATVAQMTRQWSEA